MRRISGITLVETLVSTTIMSVLALGMMSILLMNYKTNAKVMAITDNVDAVRSIKERISVDVREGRTLGDVFGQKQVDNSVAPPQIYTIGSDRFPEATRNPIYGGALPFYPAGWPAAPWRLGNQCLIVQIPVLDNHNDTATEHQLNPNKIGWPTAIPAGWSGGGPATTVTQDNVETHVYMVVPDPNNDGEWMMQFATYGGKAVPGYLPATHTHGPQTILKGIVGPLDVTGNPKVFQFINRVMPNGTADDTIQPNGSHTPEYTGVVVNLEVKRHQMQVKNRQGITETPIGMKMEVFLRNNALATSTGRPEGLN